MKNIILVTMLMSLLPVTANAYDVDMGLDTSGFPSSDFYIGIGAGSASIQIPREMESFRPDDRIKESTGLYEFHIGYHMNPYISFELGYANYGDVSGDYVKDKYITEGPVIDGVYPTYKVGEDAVTRTSDMKAVAFSTLFQYPMNKNFSVYGLVSFERFDIENTWDVEPHWGVSTDDKKRHYRTKSSSFFNDMGYGLGVRWVFSEDFTAKLQWKRNSMKDNNSRLNLSDTRLILEMSL